MTMRSLHDTHFQEAISFARSLPTERTSYILPKDGSLADKERNFYRLMTLGEGFLDSAQRHPNAHALSISDRWFTYAELDSTSRAWAATLLEAAKGKPLRRIGVFGHRSQGVYAGILTSLMLGATYVPLNSSFPIDRTAAMARAANLDAIILDNSAVELLCRMPNDALPSILFAPCLNSLMGPELPFSLITAESILNGSSFQPSPATLDDVAYILFTSGSTGTPKGVPITHRNAAHFLRHNLERYLITSSDRLSQTFDHTFDLAMFDLFMAWWSGAAVCVMSSIEALAPSHYIAQKGITIWFSVPSMARLLLKGRQLGPGSFFNLRLSLFCGEPLTRVVAESWAAAAPNSVLENVYGPTELTIACATYRWDPRRSPAECFNDIVPIGNIYHDLAHIIVGADALPVAIGEVGELCVDGPQRFAGYLDDPLSTANAFLTLAGGRKYYRTGDLVFVNTSGDLCYVGRKDTQVKVNGFRIELSEIEGEIRRLQGVIEAVVLAPPVDGDGTGGRELIAFVMGDGITKGAVLQGLKRFLPGYMIPKRIVIRSCFPLNGNGKIDRKLLAKTLLDEGVRIS